MNHFQKICRMVGWVSAILLLSAAAASAQTSRTLTVGTASGEVGAVVSVPVTISDPAGVGGIAFTLTYDPALFTFNGLEQAPTAGWTIQDPEAFRAAAPVSDGFPYYNPYRKEAPYESRSYTTAANATLFYQFNDLKNLSGASIGRVLVSGASAVPLTGSGLFRARFQIKTGVVNGTTYPIGIQRTIINNPAAGYTADTMVPALVGVGEFDGTKYTTLNFPVIPAVLAAGGITASAPVFSLGGKVTYGSGGANAAGSIVTLRRVEATGEIFSGQATVGTDGRYLFSGRQAGNYKLSVTSLDPQYNNYESPQAFALSANRSDADVALQQKLPPVRVTGTVTGGVSGLLAQVIDPDGKVIGVYSVASNGTFSSPLLPALAQGAYRWRLLYGSLSFGPFDNNATTAFDKSSLKKISGTVSGLPAGGGAVTASSANGKLTKTIQRSADGAYEITDLVPAGDYIVSAVATGLPLTYYNGKTDVNAATKLDITSADKNGIDFSFVPPAQYIKGRISESGSGVSGITVYGFDVNSFALITARTDTGGNYSLSVPKGVYEVFVIKANGKIFYFYNENGTPTQNESGALLRTISTDNQEILNTNIDITECDKTLAGRVTFRTASGDPAANVLITATSATKRALGLTGQDGGYSVGGLCGGATYTVEMKPLAGGYAVQTATITAGTDTTKDFVIDTGSVLSGAVTDSGSAAAVAGAMLYLKDQTTGALVGGRIYFSATDGRYAIRDIKSGEYTLEVTHPDYRGYTVGLVIGADTTQDVALEKGAHFKGTVSESGSGKALAGATVIVTRAGATPAYTVTNSAGGYSVYGLDATKSDYIVIAQMRGYERQAKPGQTPATAGTTAVFTLAPPVQTYTVSGSVTTDVPAGVAGAIVLVSSPTKNFFASTTTDAAGAYSLAGLAPSSDYRIVVIPPALPTQERAFTVSAANVTESFTIPVGREIGGTVTGDVAIPSATKVYVFLYKGAAYQGFVVAGSGGAFLFKGLASGSDYKLLAVATGYAPQWYSGKATIGAADPIDISTGSVPGANVTLIRQ